MKQLQARADMTLKITNTRDAKILGGGVSDQPLFVTLGRDNGVNLITTA